MIYISSFRISKNKDNPYVMVNKGWVYDNKLSAKAKGILLYLLSRPDDWQVYENEVIKNFSDGRDSIRNGIKELIKFGYIKRFQKRNENGRLNGYEYEVYEVSTVDGKTDNGKSDIGKVSPTNNNKTNNNLTEYKNDNGAKSKDVCTHTQASPYSNEDVVSVIRKYMNDFYRQKAKRNHPFLKAEQYKQVYENLENFMNENCVDAEEMYELMCAFLNSNINSDWNINHFATEGIMMNRFYEKLY